MRRVATAVMVLALMMFMAGPSLAASVHLKGGKNAEPTFTDNGLTLTADGELSGLGNGDVFVAIVATADVAATCINPGSGAHEPPGQNPAEATVEGSLTIPEDEVKNGNTPFSVVTDPPETPIPGAPDCPNPNWTEVIDDLAFTSATITVEQPLGTLVLTVTCTIDPPTSDGVVSKQDVSCTQS
jgi:hypothetical protein